MRLEGTAISMAACPELLKSPADRGIFHRAEQLVRVTTMSLNMWF